MRSPLHLVLLLASTAWARNRGGSELRPLRPTCGRGMILVEKPEGFKCLPDFSRKWGQQREDEVDFGVQFHKKRASTTTTRRPPVWEMVNEVDEVNLE